MKKKCLALFLALVLIVSSLPISVFAQNVDQGSEQEMTVEETSVDTQLKDTLNKEVADDENADEALKEDTEENEEILAVQAEEESDNVSRIFPRVWLVVEGSVRIPFGNLNLAWDHAMGMSSSNVTLYLEEALFPYSITSRLEGSERTGSLTVDLNNNTLQRLFGGGYGGGVFSFTSESSGNYTIKNGTITGGNTLQSGGAFEIDSPNLNLSLENLTLTGNHAEVNGGAIFFRRNEHTNLNIQNCTITGNTAGAKGGGVYLTKTTAGSGDNAITLLDRVDIKDNKSGGKNSNLIMDYETLAGDQIFCGTTFDDSSEVNLAFTDEKTGYFTKEMAEADAQKYQKCFKADSENQEIQIKDNRLCLENKGGPTPPGPTPPGPTPTYVATLKVTQSSGVTTIFYYEKADVAWKEAFEKFDNYEVEMTLYQDWTRKERLQFKSHDQKLTLNLNDHKIIRDISDVRMIQEGEVLSFTKTGNFVVKNGTITGGSSVNYGGGIAINGASNMQILLENLTITGNQAYWGGGIFFVPGQAKLTVKNCDISGNSATINGGGMYVSNSDQSNPMKFEEKVKINNNTCNNMSNDLVFCYENQKSHLIDATGLTAGSDIGVKFNTFNENEFRFFTTKFNSKDAKLYLGYFKSEDQRAQLIEEKNALALQRTIKYVATLTVDGNTIGYENPAQAWYDANDTNKYLNKSVTMTLYQDWDATNEYFGDGPGMGSGRFIPSKRSEENILTLDLNGFTINRQVKKSKNYGNLFSFQNEGHVIIKNGTLTGGKNSKHGGCIFFGNIPKGQSSEKQNVELINLTIRDNYSGGYGGGIYIDNNLGVHLTIKDCLITNNDVGINLGAGIYVTKDTCPSFKLVGKTQIYGNNDGYAPDLHFGKGARMNIPELSEGAYVNISATLSPSLIHEKGLDARFIQGSKDDKKKISQQLQYLHPARENEYIHMHDSEYGPYVLLANWENKEGGDEPIIDPQQDVNSSTNKSANTGISNDSRAFVWISAFVVLAMCGSVEFVNRKRRREK